MDSSTELEKYILDEVTSKNPDTFIIELHEEGTFNKTKLNTLLENCKKLNTIYHTTGKTTQYNTILSGIISTFEHTLFLISTHFMPDDNFHISNYESDLSSEIISDYYFEFRSITRNFIL